VYTISYKEGFDKKLINSKMSLKTEKFPEFLLTAYQTSSHQTGVNINNSCGYQSITQQYLKKMFNKGGSKLHVSA